MLLIKQSLLLSLLIITIDGSAAMAQPDARSKTTAFHTYSSQSFQPETHGTITLVARKRKGESNNNSNHYSYAIQTAPPEVPTAPTLQGVCGGTIEPQGADAIVVQGINSADTVRANNLANIEATLNLVAIVALIVGHVVGINYLFKTIMLSNKTAGKVLAGMAKGLSFISVGLLSPMFVNWAIALVRDAGLFN